MSAPPVRLAIAIPHRNGECHICVVRTLSSSDMRGLQVSIVDNSTTSIVENRNVLVQKFLDLPTKPTHLFFLDTDVSVPPDGIKKLLAADKPIVTGVYVDKKEMVFVVRKRLDRYHYVPVQQEWSKYPKPGTGPHWIVKDELRDKVLPCDAAGAGCLMIRREVFEQMPYPWFFEDFNPDVRGHSRESMVSEDFSFFWKANDLGIPSFVHTGVLCGHWFGTMVFPPSWREEDLRPPGG